MKGMYGKVLLICAFAAILLSGCDFSKKPPALKLTYAGEEYSALLGTYSWSYPGGGVSADAEGPLGWQDMITTVIKVPEEDSLTLHFAKAPDEYEIRLWSDDHWNDYEAYEENNVITTKDDQLTLSDEDGYIYEVHASWKEKGDAYYGFYVKPSEPDVLNAGIQKDFTEKQNDLVYHDYGTGIDLDADTTITIDGKAIDLDNDNIMVYILNIENNEIMQEFENPTDRIVSYTTMMDGVYQIIAATEAGDTLDLTMKAIIEIPVRDTKGEGVIPLSETR